MLILWTSNRKPTIVPCSHDEHDLASQSLKLRPCDIFPAFACFGESPSVFLILERYISELLTYLVWAVRLWGGICESQLTQKVRRAPSIILFDATELLLVIHGQMYVLEGLVSGRGVVIWVSADRFW